MSDDDKPSLAEAIRLLAERDRRSLGTHPTIEELAAYHAGELAPEAEARVREHMAVCHECTDLLLDLINFADLTPPAGQPDLTDDEMDEDWQSLRARMGEAAKPGKGGEVVPIRPVVPGPVPSLGRTYSPWLAVAASILAVLGFSFGLYQNARAGKLEERLNANGQPNVETTLVLQGGTHRGGSEDAPEVDARMSSGKGGTILLSPPDEGPIKVEILRGQDVLWSTEIEGEPLEIPIDIPGGFLEPGSYKVRVYGQDGGSRALDREYTFVVDDP